MRICKSIQQLLDSNNSTSRQSNVEPDEELKLFFLFILLLRLILVLCEKKLSISFSCAIGILLNFDKQKSQ